MTKNHYRAIQAALLRTCSVLAAELGPEFVSLNLDSHTDDGAWPKESLIGLAEFQVNIDDFYNGTAIIALGLNQDTNLLKSGEMVEKMLDHLLPGSSIDVFNPATLVKVGELFIQSGVRVASPLQTKTRPVIPILFAFTSNLTTDR